MAHGTLINGTSYEIGGGKTLVGGTGYSIDKGKTLVGGTGYDIEFALPAGITTNTGLTGANCIAYGNGYWVVGGYVKSGSRYDAYIAYTTDLNGSWTRKQVWAGTSNGTAVNSIVYANGYWVAVGTREDSKSYAICAYSTSLSGTWSTKISISESNFSASFDKVIYDGTNFIASGNHGYYDDDDETWIDVIIAYTTNPGSTWTQKVIDTVPYFGGTVSHAASIAYGNGYYAVSANRQDDSTIVCYLLYTTSLTGTWSTTDMWSLSSGTTNYTRVTNLTFTNGYFIACGERGWIGGTRQACAFYGANPTRMTSRYLYSASGNSSYRAAARNAVYINGYWVVAGMVADSASGKNYACVAYCSTLNGTWTYVTIIPTSTINKSNIPWIDVCDNRLVAILENDNSGDNSSKVGYANSPDELITIFQNGG